MKQNLPGVPFSSGKILAVEAGEKAVRAVVVKKEGKRAALLHAAGRERSGGDLTEDIKRLLEEEKPFKGPGILVTDEVKFLASELTFDRADTLPQEKINAAAMWEIEPYLDFPPSKGLFSCRLQSHMKREDAVPALIFAIEKGRYARFSAAFKAAGARLRSVYSPEAALAHASSFPAAGHHKLILDCRENAFNGVVLTSDGPTVFQELPLASGEIPAHEQARNLIYDMDGSTGGLDGVVIAGSSVSPELMDGLTAGQDNLRVWGGRDFGAEGPQALEIGPEYALAVGAALQHLGFALGGSLGVTNRVPLAQSLSKPFRENKRLAPGIVLGLFLVFLVGHFAVTKLALARYRAAVKELEAEKQKLLEPRMEKERLSAVLAEIQAKHDYIVNVLPNSNNHLLDLLSAVSDQIPRDVVLNRVSQRPNGTYRIEGNAFMGRSISSFNSALSSIEGCRSTHLESVQRLEDASKGRQKLLPYAFVINVTF
jgi:hypothetical protein